MPGTFVAGLLDTSPAIGNIDVAEKYRGFTISWLRYRYQDIIIQRPSVDSILAAATEQGYRYCWIQTIGTVVAERWRVGDQPLPDFFDELEDWARNGEFHVAGELLASDGGWYGLRPRWLLVDLSVHQQLGSPRYDLESKQPIALPNPTVNTDDGRLAELKPARQQVVCRPTLPGWDLVRASLNADLAVRDFSESLRAYMLDLEPTVATRRQALAKFLGDGIADYSQRSEQTQASGELSNDQQAFLEVLATQTCHARHGVFLWNIESYQDIEEPGEDFHPPVTSLYSVAAGFKPCRMLQTHAFDQNTRVVYFDYSARALEVRQCIVEQWDGEDFPRFVEWLFQKFPYPDTYYQLWDNLTPENVDRRDIQLVWERELQRWQSEEKLTQFWNAYRQLEHEYICCDLLNDPEPLLERLIDEPDSIIWWSNAFFTMYGNWFYTLAERKQAYDRFIRQIAEANPRMHLFGSDFNNTSVNSIQADAYWQHYWRSGVDATRPCKLFRTAIRM